MARLAACAMWGAVRANFSANSPGSPDVPNTSLMPTNSSGHGLICARASATALPSPPCTLWSSAATNAPVSAAQRTNNVRSIGLVVAMFTTRADTPSFASSSAARRARAPPVPPPPAAGDERDVAAVAQDAAFADFKAVVVRKKALGRVASGTHVNGTVEIQDGARGKGRFHGIGRRDEGHAGKGAKRRKVFERLHRTAVRARVEAGMARHDFGVAP